MKNHLICAALGMLVVCGEGTAADSPAGHATALADYKRAISAYFAELDDGWIPVFSGGGHQVGNVYDPTVRTLLESADRCFGTLSVRSSKVGLPPVTTQDRDTVGFFFRVQALLGLTASGTAVRITSIAFDDVTREEVSEGDLRRSFRAARCPALAPVLDRARIKEDSATSVPVLIGRVYRGKRRAVLASSSEADLAATLKAVNAAVAGSKLDIEIGVSAESSSQRIIRIVDREPVALAFAPAFVPVAVTGVTQGPDSPKTIYFQWSPYDVAGSPSHRQILRELATSAGESWDWQTSVGATVPPPR
jgi:hypothetical protein